MGNNREKNCSQHAHKVDIVVQTDVIANPDAVVVKFVAASVTPLAVFRIF